jgi:hypothetical protein
LLPVLICRLCTNCNIYICWLSFRPDIYFRSKYVGFILSLAFAYVGFMPSVTFTYVDLSLTLTFITGLNILVFLIVTFAFVAFSAKCDICYRHKYATSVLIEAVPLLALHKLHTSSFLPSFSGFTKKIYSIYHHHSPASSSRVATAAHNLHTSLFQPDKHIYLAYHQYILVCSYIVFALASNYKWQETILCLQCLRRRRQRACQATMSIRFKP